MHKKIDVIVGARPNYMKAAPVMHALERHDCEVRLIHTGQHYDPELSENLFKNLGLRKEDMNFRVGSGSHADQTAKVMVEYEKATNLWLPDITVVFGDVNSTLACALVAQKKGVKVAHVEAGCRSEDMRMPEEVNRIIVDSISNYLFCVSEFDKANLTKESIVNGDKTTVMVVGDTMIDSLKKCESSFDSSGILERLSLSEYVLCTVHRPSNVDNEVKLEKLLGAIRDLSREIEIVMPLHPRTRKMMSEVNGASKILSDSNIVTTGPLDYFDFMKLQKSAKCMLTDSGSVQSESCAFGVPCLTLRENTERPHTLVVNGGTNSLIGSSFDNIADQVSSAIIKDYSPVIDEMETGEIVADVICGR
jgi:UDP-N-acetylglucosamine 2-epimerase (non-hydrolysing)